jgi:putative nucleotidyltransferase with HDIG domain
MNLTVTFSRAFNKLPLNIREKVTLPYLFLAILLLLGAAFVVTQVVFDTVEERFTNQLVESSSLASGRLVEEENQILKVLRLIAYTQGVPAAFESDDPQALRSLAFGIIANNQQDAVEFLDSSGNRLLSIYHQQDGDIEDYEFTTGGENIFFDQAFVQYALQQREDTKGDKFAGYVPTERGVYFFISSPVYNADDQLVGVVLVGTKLSTIVKNLREETLAQITLYDFQGKTLASTFSSPSALNEQEVREVLLNQSQASFIRSNSDRELNVRDIGYREILSPWSVRGEDNLGVIGVALGESFLVSTTKVTRLQISIMTGLLLLLVIIFGINLSILITYPIMKLVEASKKVKNGDLDVRVETVSKDELALLTDNFNEMICSMRDSKKKIIDSYDSTLEGWSKALEYRNEETKGHTDRVTNLMMKSAKGLGLEESRLEHIRRGALLHDIGKMAIPDMILNKPHTLTKEEQEVMQKHPVFACEMLKEIEFLQPALTIPYCHHEHWDGSGYPRGLKGEAIPLEARIFALVDAWDAITTDRPYRKAMTTQEAVETIRNEIGTHFDPGIAERFLELVSNEN